ncbi:type II toxin-antitoxin system mRNA interferase toxin, RelE/StbE family [Candidatus Peregrinibacteria bacterium]|jgi:mRNA interferase RelE/StbE|nr:type II toxin-antitoxin system mRNA interferase toxin, RelE/StbE family [Candidatus Peregrinibacteria bacterium]MBT4632383.1 type II toxin-antitoxin system mRNA interferase toxin, RelE/StbE family [Candidatus Peregrinibacteria bacterium]MBT5516432.1 type II toxin-antitoxin system mRNA interferase toxin, RelE/StbE family [Candidatus Peregrinibacteria bacterium]MBT5823587.1 type II toxin-antitoxin system mRNA interferase toxin, RelE/StbE family [Candidatus Peregrinibacteria bacterium]
MASNFEILFTKQAKKDIQSLSPKLKAKLRLIILDVISVDPFQGKKLMGDLDGNFSYRLSLKDRIVYSVNKKKKIVYVKRARSHYGD